MIEFFSRLFVGHAHKFVVVRNVNILGEDGNTYCGIIMVMQCEICGKLKNHKIKW